MQELERGFEVVYCRRFLKVLIARAGRRRVSSSSGRRTAAAAGGRQPISPVAASCYSASGRWPLGRAAAGSMKQIGSSSRAMHTNSE